MSDYQEKQAQMKQQIGYREQTLRCCETCKHSAPMDYYAHWVDTCYVLSEWEVGPLNNGIGIRPFDICDRYEPEDSQ